MIFALIAAAALLKSPMASTSAVTASRSGTVRCGFQTSMISTTRVREPRFQASCSKVSSNTTARPSRHSCRLAADDQRAALGNDERQVADDARVGDAAVRQDVRAGRQHREHDLRRVLADAHERKALERRRGVRAERCEIVAPLAVAVEIEAVPRRRAGRTRESELLGRLTDENALVQAGGGNHGQQFLADRVGLALESLDPRERRALEVGRGRQAREKQERRSSGAGPEAMRGDLPGGPRGSPRSAGAPRGRGARTGARGPFKCAAPSGFHVTHRVRHAVEEGGRRRRLVEPAALACASVMAR